MIDLKEKLLQTYQTKYNHDGISGERIAARLQALAEIGLTEDGGSYRIGYSQEEQQAKELVMNWMQDAGLETVQDGAGNVFGRLQGKDPELPAIMSGSHVDSVPNGGHFDGTLGVLAALEVAEAWKEKAFIPKRSYEVAIFTDEEGACFNSGFTGSKAATGGYDIEQLLALKNSDGKSFTEVLADRGYSKESYQASERNFHNVAAFIEVHIEQGKKLEKADLPCGAVTGIAGPCWLEVCFHGEAGHAGNTPMNDRKDALIAASEFITAVNAIPKEISETAVATVGKLLVHPNGINVIPGKVTLTVDIRDIYEDKREIIIQQTIKEIDRISKMYGIKAAWTELSNTAPVLIEQAFIDRFTTALTDNGMKAIQMPSGAGHDGMILNEKIPIAMLFVKSKDGISHNPKEWSDLNDCVQAIHVLKNMIENYDSLIF